MLPVLGNEHVELPVDLLDEIYWLPMRPVPLRSRTLVLGIMYCTLAGRPLTWLANLLTEGLDRGEEQPEHWALFQAGREVLRCSTRCTS